MATRTTPHGYKSDLGKLWLSEEQVAVQNAPSWKAVTPVKRLAHMTAQYAMKNGKVTKIRRAKLPAPRLVRIHHKQIFRDDSTVTTAVEFDYQTRAPTDVKVVKKLKRSPQGENQDLEMPTLCMWCRNILVRYAL